MNEIFKYIEVRTYTGNVVRRIDVSSKTQKQAEKVERGILLTMNTDKYYTEIIESNTPINCF